MKKESDDHTWLERPLSDIDGLPKEPHKYKARVAAEKRAIKTLSIAFLIIALIFFMIGRCSV